MAISRPEAHAMDINTVNIWLTNAKHQPTKTVEIEGTPATRQASLMEFFTSVATSAAFEVGSRLATDLVNLDVIQVNKIGAEFGSSSFIYKAADGILSTKEFIKETTSAIVSTADDLTKPVVDLFEQGYTAAKTLVNPLKGTYTDAIQKAGSAAVAYANQASSLAAVGIDNTAMLSAQQFTNGQGIPALQGVEDHTDNLTTGSFTVDDAILKSAPPEESVTSIWSAITDIPEPEYEPVTNNDTLQALGFNEQPTFEDMCGIFTKQELHDNLEAAIDDEEIKRDALENALLLGVVQDINTAYTAWQQSFETYKSCVLALRTETRNNIKKILEVIAQENSLLAIYRVNTIRNTITDPSIKAVYDSLVPGNLRDASNALDTFIQGPPEA